jgi:hypothetical protein
LVVLIDFKRYCCLLSTVWYLSQNSRRMLDLRLHSAACSAAAALAETLGNYQASMHCYGKVHDLLR